MKLRAFFTWVFETGTRTRLFWPLNIAFVLLPTAIEAMGEGHWFAWVFCCGLCLPSLWVATWYNWNKRPPQ